MTNKNAILFKQNVCSEIFQSDVIFYFCMKSWVEQKINNNVLWTQTVYFKLIFHLILLLLLLNHCLEEEKTCIKERFYQELFNKPSCESRERSA